MARDVDGFLRVLHETLPNTFPKPDPIDQPAPVLAFYKIQRLHPGFYVGTALPLRLQIVKKRTDAKSLRRSIC